MFGSDLMGNLAGAFLAKSFWKWTAIIGGIALIGYAGTLKVENMRLSKKVDMLKVKVVSLQQQADILIEENSDLRAVAEMTVEQCKNIVEYERNKPTKPNDENPITQEFLNEIFKGGKKP